MDLDSYMTNPAIVLASSSGKSISKVLFKSLIVMSPFTIQDPSFCEERPGSVLSYSSSISPTISSKISSRVIIPLKSPYSSTTTAKCSRLFLKA